ncbi:MAG: tetratricopeptide repeat protein [Phycisphaerae bacterium]|nr:tetratricopeptide repeat protein [Phycisphaerae bacterium]
MSHLLEALGRGLPCDLGDVLDRYYWSPQLRTVQELTAEAEAHPQWPDIHCQLGLAYLRGMQLAPAVEHLQTACRIKPDYLAARVAMAAAYHASGQVAKALEQLEIANQTHTGEPAVLFAIGFCYEVLNQPQRAADYYRDTIRRDEAFMAARQRLAAVALRLDTVQEAIEHYQVLRQQNPQDTWVRSALAHLYYRAGQYGLAVDEFESAIAMEPENWSLTDDEVEAMVADGLIREAIERLHGLIEQQGPFADLHVRLADLYAQVGNDDAAMKHYRLALEIQDNYLEAQVKMGTQHLSCGRWEEAAEVFGEACELNDRLLVSYVGIGVCQAAMGRREDAISSFELAAAVEPNSTLLLAEMSKLQLKAVLAGELEKGFELAPEGQPPDIVLEPDDLLHRQVERHQECLQAHPDYADVRYRYGVLLRAEGRGAEAMEQFAKAVELNPSYVQALIKLGITQQELGMAEEAIETFKRALEIQPKYVDLHYRLGLLYTDRRELEQAMQHMEVAAAAAPEQGEIRTGLALALQNMGLMDRAATVWRSLQLVNSHGTS